MWGLFEQRANQMGLVRLFRLIPQNIWYIQHCSGTPHPMFELTPRAKGGDCSNSEKSNFNTLFKRYLVFNLRIMYAKNSIYS